MEVLTNEQIQYGILYHSLLSLGDFYPLNIFLDPLAVTSGLEHFSDHWRHYNPRKPHIPRLGISLTSLDGGTSGVPDLDSIKEFNSLYGTNYNEDSFSAPTPVWKQVDQLRKLDLFLPHLGRSHILKLNQGGYFPFHRDGVGLVGAHTTFRLIAVLDKCGSGQFCFLYDERRIFLEPGWLYFMNTNIEHALMSFGNDSTILVLNVKLSKESVELVVGNLRAR